MSTLRPSDLSYIVSQCDALVDTYGSASHGLTSLLEMRRDLAVHMYRLTAHVKAAHGSAGITYGRRKFAIAKEVVAARRIDGKEAIALCEARAETLNSTQEQREAEVWAGAELETLKSKIDMGKQVLQAMQQEISVLAWEERTAHYQSAQA